MSFTNETLSSETVFSLSWPENIVLAGVILDYLHDQTSCGALAASWAFPQLKKCPCFTFSQMTFSVKDPVTDPVKSKKTFLS